MEWFFSAAALVVVVYFLWEQRVAILLALSMIVAILFLTAWLFRPFWPSVAPLDALGLSVPAHAQEATEVPPITRDKRATCTNR